MGLGGGALCFGSFGGASFGRGGASLGGESMGTEGAFGLEDLRGELDRGVPAGLWLGLTFT